MKWRDRISILSRKRNHGSVGSSLDKQSDLPSGSGIIHDGNLASSSAPVESVETTLAQIRPVIGPDHKSYYVLLRGNEDSFMCIQPGKDVINSLDEVFKNVNSVKLAKSSLQSSELPPSAKRPRYSQAKTYTGTLTHKQLNNIRRNGVRNSNSLLINEDERLGSGVSLENLFLTKTGDSSPSTDSVVENVILNRTVQNLNKDHRNQMVRTSTLVYPLVQNRLGSNSTVSVNTKQESCLFITSDHSNEGGSDTIFLPTAEIDLIKNIAQSASTVRKRECKTNQTQAVSTGEKHVTRQSYLSEALEAVGSHTKDLGCELTVTGQSSPPTELRLIAKEGTVLTEEEITSQIKILIESEQLVVGEDNQIVVIRVSAREAMVKIVLNDPELGDAQEEQQQETIKAIRNKQTATDEIIVGDAVSLPLSMSAVTDEDCYSPEIMVSNKDHSRDVEYLFTSYCQPQQEFAESREIVRDPGLQEAVHQTPSCVVDSLVEPLVDPLGDTQQHEEQADEFEKLQYQVDGIESIGDSLLSGTEGEIVVFQREDGAFVNQCQGCTAISSSEEMDSFGVRSPLTRLYSILTIDDEATSLKDGTPVSSELQYLIANSQQDYTSTLEPEEQTNHVLVPPETFEHHTIDVNSGL